MESTGCNEFRTNFQRKYQSGFVYKKMPHCEQSNEWLNRALVTEETTSFHFGQSFVDLWHIIPNLDSMLQNVEK